MTGAAWLSSARVVRCWVKSRNERNPYHYLPARYGGNFNETAGDKPEEGGTTSSHHGPYGLGYTRATMDNTMGSQPARGSKSNKIILSPDRSLQLDFVKLESLVIVYQQWYGEYVPGSCTHRPSHHGSWLHQK